MFLNALHRCTAVSRAALPPRAAALSGLSRCSALGGRVACSPGLIARQLCTTPAKAESTGILTIARDWAHFGLAAGAFYAADLALKKTFAAAGISFPAPLVGLFGILGGLCALAGTGRLALAESIVAAARPALGWITRYLPIFYFPALVVVPIAVERARRADPHSPHHRTHRTRRGVGPTARPPRAGLSTAELGKIAAIVGVGMPFQLFAAGAIVLAIRRLAAVSLVPVPPIPPPPPFTWVHMAGWAAAVVGAALCLAQSDAGSDMAWASQQATLLACTVLGLIVGSAPPAAIAAFMPHPVLVTTAAAHVGVLICSTLTSTGYKDTLRSYVTKGKNGQREGAGDLLMSFLGMVILTFGFHIYGQRALLRRHAVEVLGCVGLSTILSLCVTVAAGRALSLDPDLALAISPRSVTVALAMPIATQLGVSEESIPICAAAVLFTGLIGAVACRPLLNFGRFQDPLTRGLATASASHGFGTAALAATEPQALPFCALAYGLGGIASSLWASVPAVRDFLIALAGGSAAGRPTGEPATTTTA